MLRPRRGHHCHCTALPIVETPRLVVERVRFTLRKAILHHRGIFDRVDIGEKLSENERSKVRVNVSDGRCE